MRSQRVNESKLTSRSAFIGDLFALGGEKESKYDKEPLVSDYLRNLDLSLHPLPQKDAYMSLFAFRNQN